MTTIHDIDDPRLTAWALGELEGADAAAVAAFVNESAAARAAVDQIRELAGMLGSELAEEASADGLALDEGRRVALRQTLEQKPAKPATRRPTQVTRLRPFMAVAAVLLVGFFVVDVLVNSGVSDSGNGVDATKLSASNEFARSLPIIITATQELLEEEDEHERLRQLGYLGEGGRSGLEEVLEPLAFEEPRFETEAPVFFENVAPQEALAAAGNGSASGMAGAAPGTTGGEFNVVAPARASGLLSGRGRSKAAAVAVGSRAELAQPKLAALKALGYVSDSGATDTDRNDESDLRVLTGRGRTTRSGGERYLPIAENPFVPITSDALSALSTFSIDVDTASYSNMRRFLHHNQLPPANAVRIEELINYFSYDDPAPEGGDVPFSTTVEVTDCPWQPRHRLLRVALVGERVAADERAATHLVFLLDVSGSMSNADKLPLLIKSFELLLEDMSAEDKVSIVTYASGTELVLPPTSCAEKQTILAALHGLQAGGSTHASAGIQMAYKVAADGFIEGGNNRILLATDGDFNVGITSDGGLYDLIRAKAASGVFLTVLGFGTGNLKDATAELLADNGNGNYAYIDSLTEAYKVLVAERDATLVTIAKDVKIQVEFNPGRVAAYRLIGYENRRMAATDFRDDKKDAGEIGAGHSVVALYEVVPRGVEGVTGTVEFKYQQLPEPETFVDSPELLTVNLRWKRPDEEVGRELAVPVVDGGMAFAEAGEEFRFSSAVAAFGMVLRGSQYAGEANLAWVIETADAARSFDPLGDRSEFVRLVRTAQGLLGR